VLTLLVPRGAFFRFTRWSSAREPDGLDRRQPRS